MERIRSPWKKTPRIPIKDPVFSRLLPPTRPYPCLEYLWNKNNFKNLFYSNQTRHVFETDLESQVDRRRDFFEKHAKVDTLGRDGGSNI